MRLLAIKRYADWVSKPKFVFVDIEQLNDETIKLLLNKMREERIKNVGGFVVLEIHKDFCYLYTFRNGIPKSLHDFYERDESVGYLRFDELRIINWAFENYLKYG